MTFLTLGISKLSVLVWVLNYLKEKYLHVDKHVLRIQYITCLSVGDIPNAWRFQEYYFLIWNPIKDCFSDSWILKTQADPTSWMVLIISMEWIQTVKTLSLILRRRKAKMQTSNLKVGFVKAKFLEQKLIISWFERPQMGGCVFFGRSGGRTVGYNTFRHMTSL